MSQSSIAASYHAWLAPYYAALRRSPAFATLAPDLQARALADAVAHDYPARAHEIREWNAATRDAMLGVLDDLTQRHARQARVSGLVRDEGRAHDVLCRGLSPAWR